MGLLAQYGDDFKRIAAAMPNNVSTLRRSQTPDPPPQEDKPEEDSSELARDVVNANHDRSFTVSDVPPISATSRSHLMDLQPHTFPIPGSSSGPTLRLYS